MGSVRLGVGHRVWMGLNDLLLGVGAKIEEEEIKLDRLDRLGYFPLT